MIIFNIESYPHGCIQPARKYTEIVEASFFNYLGNKNPMHYVVSKY